MKWPRHRKLRHGMGSNQPEADKKATSVEVALAGSQCIALD